MNLILRHRWFAAAAGITAAYGVVSLIAHRGNVLTVFADGVGLLLMLLAAAVTLRNAVSGQGEERGFWLLMTLGFCLWAGNQAAWGYCEIIQRREIPDPFFFDIVLFFHVVPMIAAVAWRADVGKRQRQILLTALNFAMLLGWWIFLYAFIVFPHQYVVLNVGVYDRYYDGLYLVENGLLLVVLAHASVTSSQGWRRLYGNLLGAAAVYGVGSQLLDRAVARGTYYSGSLYDVPLVGAVLWMAATAWSARGWNLRVVEASEKRRWKNLIAQLAMLAILSFPVLGAWAVLLDPSPEAARVFRVHVVLTGMLLLGAFVFLRQYVQDQALMKVLEESRQAFDSQRKLQNQLVQKEKLSSLGSLVAGAAHEIDHPLMEIMNSSEQLWMQERLSDEQNALLRKILTHAQRSRDLVASLLRFAQRAPGEKAPVDLSMLLNRAVQMVEWRYLASKIQVRVATETELPKVWGNVNQLLQAFVEIVENGMDALQGTTGGTLQITGQKQHEEAVIEFSDNGPGMREPLRVFDPFYTTKPVGKGTGLGLSVAYGVVQDHGGQISCLNKPEGGALFVVRLPAAAESAAAGAGGD